MMKFNFIIILVAIAYTTDSSLITEENFAKITAVPFAYGDFNADKLVDIFCVTQYKSIYQIQIWLQLPNTASNANSIFSNISKSIDFNYPIVNIVPGDFNGDSIMDILVVYKSDSKYKISLFLGNKSYVYQNDLGQPIAYDDQLLVEQPFVADFDGDGRLDLLVKKDSEKQIIYFDNYGQIDRSKTGNLSPPTSNSIYEGYAPSLSDINNDFIPDFTLVVKNSATGSLSFEQWIRDPNTDTYTSSNPYDVPQGLVIYGQSIFADYDSDGTIEHLLPGCKDSDCKKSVIYIYKHNEWNELTDADFGSYGFVPPSDSDSNFWGPNQISVKVGDHDLNGYLDLLVILRNNNSTSSKTETYAALMSNVASSSAENRTFSRTFKIATSLNKLLGHTNVVQASFFDISEDGYLDILLTVRDNDSFKVIPYMNEYVNDDVYFLKVMVIPGLSTTYQPGLWNTMPYGLDYPGALIKMETTSYDFKPVVLYACQLSQTSYMSLQLPYIIFGLGSTPNFVEQLTVGILVPKKTDQSQYTKVWRQQIIPNSQLVINPTLRDYSYNWQMQLFLTPSKNILMTAISLGSTMVCLAIIIAVLQFREKKMDEKERKLESQRFHFDGL